MIITLKQLNQALSLGGGRAPDGKGEQKLCSVDGARSSCLPCWLGDLSNMRQRARRTPTSSPGTNLAGEPRDHLTIIPTAQSTSGAGKQAAERARVHRRRADQSQRGNSVGMRDRQALPISTGHSRMALP
jgi:hypothetical protein